MPPEQTPADAGSDTAQTQAQAPAPATQAPETPAPSDAGGEAPSNPDQLLFENKDEANPDDKPEGEQGKEGEQEAVQHLTADDIVVPDDMPISDERKQVLNDLFKKHGVHGDDKKAMMQELIDIYVNDKKSELSNWTAMKNQMRQETVDDPDIGGERLKQNLHHANDVIRKFAGSPEFGGSPETLEKVQEHLVLLGLGNNKHFIKMMVNIANSTKGGSLIVGSNGGGGKEMSRDEMIAKSAWPDMK